MIFAGMDRGFEAARQLDAPLRAEPALEHGELEPAPVAVHQLEHATPAAVVGNVIGDDVETLFDMLYLIR